MSFIKKIVQKFKKAPTPRFTFVNVGFHGDDYLLKVVDFLANLPSKNFIETGSNVGSTLTYTAKKYPNLTCISCEPDSEAFQHATKNSKEANNVILYNQLSQDFLTTLQQKHSNTFEEKSIFWLDAHGYGFDWPLKEEVNFIMTNYKDYLILIDDFLVPNAEHFLYDVYKEHICSYDYIKEAIPTEAKFSLYYPNYKEKTSKHHPLKGWCLLSSSPVSFPKEIQAYIREEVL